MEHLVILLIHLVRWLDGLSLKSLRKALPNLAQLHANPQAVLPAQEVTIGPSRRYASGVALGILIAVGIEIGLILTVVEFFLKRANPQAGPIRATIFLISFIVAAVGAIWSMLYLLRGGHILLKLDGVEFHHRRTVVSCPWALFNVPGQPFRPSSDRFLLPVAPAVIPFIEAQKDSLATLRGREVNTNVLMVKGEDTVSLKNHYEVDGIELGAFLLDLGRKLGGKTPRGAIPYVETAAPVEANGKAAVEEHDGWLTVSLTRVNFPPFCCDCGAYTTDVQEFRGFASLIRLGSWMHIEGGEHVRVWVPVCGPCQSRSRTLRRSTLFKALFTNLGIAVVLTIALAVVFGQPGLLGLICVLSPFIVGIGFLLGNRAFKRRFRPVELGRYSSRNGTVALRFRRREYQEALLHVMEN